MSIGKPRDRGKERFWRTIVRQWRESGLSVCRFCEANSLSKPSFYAWRRTLAERDGAAVKFVPVRVTAEPDPPSARPIDASAGAVELILGSGRRLRVGPGFDAATLARLLAVLEESRP